ncbi:dihydromonapterin reductase [Rouxiella badensis]|uniref:dihydromonapterin reductase n=1 Tax=Rouxiella badensis TaxID=1646377 RepID=UPI00035DBBBA|nr:dihydromonapterin reductase [Rouxiella badensis]MCC3701677.1 dihydromonapterin reductase [Rouxiella badensis]MCC3731319.1 dihydromonapterin reductase [Rouxiella badensis]MCC3738254.1 dihydromonapterin reductase [Rouxiella badensis]MCC3748726.1 dihydromonapterin reductase [Rouxiella badensis]MCC3756708.1 dihydromonapterin reductase [Rouxiella badensis]
MTDFIPSAPVLITGGAKRIGLALAESMLEKKIPVIVSYRQPYPALEELIKKGACCIQADFSENAGILAFAEKVRAQTGKLRAIIHNASSWVAESPDTAPQDTMAMMLQIHVYTPYLLNLELEECLRGQGTAGADIIHITDFVVEKGSKKHIAYSASKAALDNMTLSFARKLAPEVKVNSIAPALILFNPEDDASYREHALNKSLMKIEPGESEIVNLVDYIMRSKYVTGKTLGVDGGRRLR